MNSVQKLQTPWEFITAPSTFSGRRHFLQCYCLAPKSKNVFSKPKQVSKGFRCGKFLDPFLKPCLHGEHVGLLSEAGCPGIADPGADIVSIAHKENIKVVPLVGPSSILLALMSSGMNGQSFAFNGYLPIDKSERKKSLKSLEKLSLDKKQTQLFIETPYRNNKMLEDICSSLHPNTRVCVACDITLPTEYIKTQTVNEWKHTNIDLHKRPAIFIIQKDY